MSLKILFFDNHILVVEKPAALLTQQTKSSTDSLEERAKQWLKNKLKKKGAVFLHAVQRLDKPVSGLVLFAKTSKALTRLNKQVRDRKIQKTYIAEVEGAIQHKKKEIRSFIAHGSFRSKQVKQEDRDAKEALLVYTVIKKRNNRTLLEIELITGRYHQIRMQLSSLGHPIIGDKKYGSTVYKKGGIHLACTKLCFSHPVTGKKLTFEFAPPF